MSGEEEDTLGLLFGEQMTDPLAASAEAYPFTRTEVPYEFQSATKILCTHDLVGIPF